MQRLSAYIFILLTWGALCSPFSVYSQKKKKTNTPTLTQQDSLSLESAFIDATELYLTEDYNSAIKIYESI